MLVPARNNKKEYDNLTALNHVLAFTNEQDLLCHEEFVFAWFHLHYYTHMKAIFYPPMATPALKPGLLHDGSLVIIRTDTFI